jgi:signal transduction histidine kinase
MDNTAVSGSDPSGPNSLWRDSLSIRLLAVTIGVILLVELLIFIPSAVNFRDRWIDERVQAARIATLALDASSEQAVSDELSAELLANAEVLAVSELRPDLRRLILSSPQDPDAEMHWVDRTNEPWFTRAGHMFSLLLLSQDAILSVSDISNDPEARIEVVIAEMPLAMEVADFSRRILVLSLLISITAGTFVYLVLVAMVVRPMRVVTASIINFHKDPGAARSPRATSTRKDQIGRAQNALADMEKEVSDAFRQRQRLAELGEAVAKINHDLRNSLAAAQLVSEGLARSEDPRVQRAAPRLERVLERAINLTEDTLQYGKAKPPEPKMEMANLHDTVSEAAREAMSAYPALKLTIALSKNAKANIDTDHLHRVIVNLVRNAAQATAKARPEGGEISIDLDGNSLLCRDNGPGMPENARDNVFTPFAGSNSKGGTGLGLAIARELMQAMGGDVSLEKTGPDGTVFRISLAEILPD